MAAFAWWFQRQHVGNAQEYWQKTAAKLTTELPAKDRLAIVDQLSKQEEVLVALADDYPDIPQNLTAYIAAWDPEAPAVDLEVLRADAVANVNRQAAVQRAQYLTAGIGMDLVYGKKLKEAETKIANPSIADEKIQHVVNEAVLNNISTAAMAQLIVDTEATWAELSAPIEQKRMAAKKAIAEAETAEMINNAVNINWVS